MPETRRYTVLITDLVDSTKLATELGDRRVVEVWMAHDRAARDLLPIHDGWEVDKSDGFLILFERPLDGVRYAIAYHRALVRLSEELGVRLRARAGLHEGEISVIRTPPEDIARGAKQWEVEGLAKPMAARIMSVALGGQTLLSGSTLEAIQAAWPRGHKDPEIRFLSHGHYRMKGVADPVEVIEAAVAESPLQPPPDAPKVYRVVQSPSGWAPARELPNNLPAGRASFLGRSVELRAIADALDGGARLVTLVGPGGTGKTALALRFGATFLGDWPGGVWLADLSEARTDLDILRALARALSVPLDQGEAIGTLGAALASRGTTLILLDNFEQIIQFSASTVGRLLDQAPLAAFLVTSRQRLGLRGERVVPVEPLPLPPLDAPPIALHEHPASALFIERASAVQPSFVVDEAQGRAVAQLVHLLDGLPLAIELAAARVRVLPPQKILERMGRRFDLLRGGARGTPDRQGTLRGALDWSWDLLEPHARAALAQCAVFEGSFDLESAEAVLDLSGFPDAPWPVDVLEALVEQSLVRALPGDQARFAFFQSIHEYAREKLLDPAAVHAGDGAVTGPEAARAAEGRHARWYGRWGQPANLERLRGRQTRAQLEADLDNVVAAARRNPGEDGALATLGALALLQDSGPLALAIELAERALARSPDARLRARLSTALGVVLNRAGRAEEALPHLERALAEARAQGDLGLEGDALAALGQRALLLGGLDEARAHYEAALGLHRQAHDRVGEAGALAELAHVIGIRGGDFATARPLLEAALAIHAARGDEQGEALCRSHLGALLSIQGDLEGGRAAYQQARDLARVVGDRRTEGLSEGMIASIRTLQGDLDGARPHFEAALSAVASIGDRVHEAILAANLGDLLARQGQDDRAAAMLERAIALARETGLAAAEGAALGVLGELRARSGSPAEALSLLSAGEARLREAGDPTELGKLLCKLGIVEAGLGGRAQARARLDEVREIARRLGHGEDSELVASATRLAGVLGV